MIPDSVAYLLICAVALIAAEWWHARCRRQAEHEERVRRARLGLDAAVREIRARRTATTTEPPEAA